jgi:hypothetical protein
LETLPEPPYRQAGGAAALVTLTRRGRSLAKGYNGSAVLAVKT